MTKATYDLNIPFFTRSCLIRAMARTFEGSLSATKWALYGDMPLYHLPGYKYGMKVLSTHFQYSSTLVTYKMPSKRVSTSI